MEQCHMKFVKKSHHLKRRGRKALVYSRCFRGHNLHSRVTDFARFNYIFCFVR